MSVKITVDKTKDKKRKVACSGCNKETNHLVYSSLESFWDEGVIKGNDTYEIIRCLGCDNISFRIGSSNSEDCFSGPDDEIIYPETVEIYPNRLIGRTGLEDKIFLPEKVKLIYNETLNAFYTKLKILATVGIRALIEAVCLEEKAEGGNLQIKVDDLVKKEVLTRRNAEILHKTRFLGNKSAHEIIAPSDFELDVAFDIIENLLETVYIIPKKAERLK